MSTKEENATYELSPDDLEMVVGGSAPSPMGLGGSVHPSGGHHLYGMLSSTAFVGDVATTGAAPCGLGGNSGAASPVHHAQPASEQIVAQGAREAFEPLVVDHGGPMGLGGNS